MPNFDLFYVWSGEGEVEVNGVHYDVGPGSCFLFRPGDYTSATHNPKKPLVLTYIHFSTEESVEVIPKRYRHLTDTIDFEFLLSRYVRLFLIQTFAAEEEAKLVLKQIMIHLLRADFQTPIEKKASNQLTDAIQALNESEKVYAYDFDGKRYDVGEKLGFVKTTVELALQNDEIKDELLEYLIEVTEEARVKQ